MADRELPRDEFSSELRRLTADPAAVRRDATIDVLDDYGNLTTWRVTTFRDSGSRETIFLQRQNVEGGVRFVLPWPVVAAVVRQRSSATAVNRRRGARAAVETRKARGIKPAFGRKK